LVRAQSQRDECTSADAMIWMAWVTPLLVHEMLLAFGRG
jgi:hypothetical protein